MAVPGRYSNTRIPDFYIDSICFHRAFSGAFTPVFLIVASFINRAGQQMFAGFNGNTALSINRFHGILKKVKERLLNPLLVCEYSQFIRDVYSN